MKMKSLRIFPLLVTVIILFFSCDEIVTYNDNYDDGLTSYGPPDISYISPVEYPDSVIGTGEMGQMVIIHGSNLTGLKEILFNDRVVDLNETYAVNKQITVFIPAVEPENITNVLTVTTEKGTITFPFEVKFPPLIFNGISHEFASEGDLVDIYGKNLMLYGLTKENAEIQINGAPVTVDSSTDTYIRIVVPAAVPDNSPLTISSEKLLFRLGEAVELTYRDRGYQFVDLGEDAFTHPATMDYVTDGTNAGDPSILISGINILRMNKEVEQFSWNFILNFYPFDLDFNSDPLLSDMLTNAADYELRYELYISTNNAISNPSDQLIVALKNSKSEPAENDVIYPAASGVAFDTKDRWLSMKLTSMDKYVKTDGSTLLESESNNLAVALTNSTGKPVTFDFSVTNFRFVKKIYFEKAP